MRTPETETRYQSTASALIRDFHEDHPNVDLSTRPGLVTFAAWVSEISHRRDWSRASWRQNRAAVVYAISASIGEEIGEWVRETINTFSENDKAKYGDHRKQPSRETKMREAPDAQVRALTAHLEGTDSIWAHFTSLWLRANLIVGLRPTEWASAEMSPENRTLRIKNAKHTNGRAHGEYRTLHLRDISDEEWHMIDRMRIEYQQRIADGVTPEYLRMMAKKSIHRARAALKKAGLKIGNISLYSTRHQMVANLRAANLSPRESAAILGHANTDSHMTHYGRKARGRKGAPIARGDEEDMARVMIGKDHEKLAAMMAARHDAASLESASELD